jgi:dihydrofolate synthase/folylpolyglutamate synthase
MFYRIGEKAYKADLTNTLALCSHLSNPQQQFKSVHIAGTNGKGSTSHMLAAIFQAAGYKTGLYTSPHLKSFTERIRIDGKPVAEDFVTDFVNTHKVFVEELQPSFFELTVGMAFDYFAKNKVDIAIIETGLGGRLDSTNVIVPEVSVITNISFDHQKILGDTLEKIAAEKAGIIKKDVPVVIGEYQPETALVFEAKSKAENASLYFASKKYQLNPKEMVKGKRQADIYDTTDNKLLLVENLDIELLGEYQFKNVITIFQTIEVLKNQGWQLSEQHIRKGLAETTSLTGLKGRWQIIGEHPLTICDVAHNEGGIKEITQQLKHVDFQNLYWILGTVNDKDLSKVLPLLPENAFYFFCEPHLPRALKAAELAQEAQKYGLKGKIIEDVNDALAHARQLATQNDMILIAGSNFIVAEVNEL